MGINGKDKQDVFDEYFNSENTVIIDGVDVSECYFYYKGECRCELNCIDLYKNKMITELAKRTPEHNYMECKPSNNCYFKQLQRLKAENERLRQYKQSKQASYEAILNENHKQTNYKHSQSVCYLSAETPTDNGQTEKRAVL